MNWFLGSIQEAVATAKKKRAFFVVYVEGSDPLSKHMTRALDNQIISKKFGSDNFVAIKLASGSEGHKQFEEIYKLVPVPSVFFIDQNGSPAEVVVWDDSEETVLKKLTNAIEKCSPSKSEILTEKLPTRTDQPSTSSASSACSAFISAETSESSKQELPSASSSKDASNLKAAEEESQDKMPANVNSDPKKVLKENNKVTSEDSKNAASDTGKPPDKGAPIEERIEKAKVLLEKKKEEKMLEERKKEKEAELERRRVGQEVLLAKREQQDKELRQLREDREREKREEALARQRILDQIAQDRAERAQRLSMTSPPGPNESQPSPPEIAPVVPPSAPVNSDVGRLQFKLPSGETKSHVFPAETTLSKVREFIDNNIVLPFSDYQLATTFPRREFTTRDNNRDLRSLQLIPSAVILILPLHGSLTMRSSFGWTKMIVDLMWDLAKPVISLSRYIRNLIFRRGNNGESSSSSDTTSASRTQPPPSSAGMSSQTYTSPAAQRLGGRSTIRKRGNIYSLRDNNDDNDENNTWNGNSTQQM